MKSSIKSSIFATLLLFILIPYLPQAVYAGCRCVTGEACYDDSYFCQCEGEDPGYCSSGCQNAGESCNLGCIPKPTCSDIHCTPSELDSCSSCHAKGPIPLNNYAVCMISTKGKIFDCGLPYRCYNTIQQPCCEDSDSSKGNCEDSNSVLCYEEPGGSWRCPSESRFNGYECEIIVPCPVGLHCRGVYGKWDASDPHGTKCVQCSDNKEVKICGDVFGLYVNFAKKDCSCEVDYWCLQECMGDPICASLCYSCGTGCQNSGQICDPIKGDCIAATSCSGQYCELAGNNRCESACGADSACDEKNPGDFCEVGESCESLGDTCQPGQICNDQCKCEVPECSDDSECPAQYICDPDSKQCVTCNKYHIEYQSLYVQPDNRCESDETGIRFTKGVRQSCCTANYSCDEVIPRPIDPISDCDEYCQYSPLSKCWNEGQAISQTGVTTGNGKATTIRLWNQDKEGYMWSCSNYDDSGNCISSGQLGPDLTVPCSDTGSQNINWDTNEVQGVKIYIKDSDCDAQSYEFQIRNSAGENLFRQGVGCGSCGLSDCPNTGWGECGRVIIDNVFVPSTKKIQYARCWNNNDDCKIFVDGTERASISCCDLDTNDVDVDQYMSSGDWHRVSIENYQRCPDCSSSCIIDNCAGCDNTYNHKMIVKDSSSEVIWKSDSDSIAETEANPYTDFSSCCGSRYIVNLFWCKGCVDDDICKDYGETWSTGDEDCTCNSDGIISCNPQSSGGSFIKILNALRVFWKEYFKNNY